MNALPAITRHITIRERQRWFLPGNTRRPARTIQEVHADLGYVDYAIANGERRWCLLSSFAGWVRTYRAYVA